MNPFLEMPSQIETLLEKRHILTPPPYNKYEIPPYSICRILLLQSIEYDSIQVKHFLLRNTHDFYLRQQLALLASLDYNQSQSLFNLHPSNLTLLERTISLEQLTIDLTATLAQRESIIPFIAALKFVLTENVDHLYRFSNLLSLETQIKAENLVGGYTEILPGRPLCMQHRHPYNEIHKSLAYDPNTPTTYLNLMTIIAVTHYIFNLYTQFATEYSSHLGRQLYQEIACIKEAHLHHYESLVDSSLSPLEQLILKTYTKCYLYYSCLEDEDVPYLKNIYEHFFENERATLTFISHLLKIPSHTNLLLNEFPEPLCLGPNIRYIRDELLSSIHLTSFESDYMPYILLPSNTHYFTYQNLLNPNHLESPSHTVIQSHIALYEQDYRYEIAPHPITQLQDRTKAIHTL